MLKVTCIIPSTCTDKTIPYLKKCINSIHNSAKNLKILICFETNCSGETIATENIIKVLKKRNGIRIYSRYSKPLQKLNFISFFSWIIKSISVWVKVIWKINKLDWVYTTTYTAGVAATLLKPLRTYKIAFHYHGTRIPEFSKNLSFKSSLTQLIKRKIVLAFHNYCLESCEVIFVPSNFTKTQIINLIPNLKNKKIVVIPNGVASHFFRKSSILRRKKLFKKYFITPKVKIITFIGLIDKRKNIELLINAFFYLSKMQKVILLLVNFQPRNQVELGYKQKLLSLLRKLNLDNKTIWLTNPVNIKDFYNISDLVVLPSRQEHFPLVFLEALATQTLFMSTAKGALSNLLAKIEPRLVIKTENPKKLALQIFRINNLSNKHKKRILKNGLQLAKNFTWEKTSKKIYTNIIS